MFATSLHAHVVLAHVHAVGREFEGEFGGVIDDEGHVELSTDRHHVASAAALRVEVEVLFAQLDDVDAPAQSRPEEVDHVVSHAHAQVQAAR